MTHWQVLHGEDPQEADEQAAGQDALLARPSGISSWRRTAARDGAELISWPPHVHTSKNGEGVRYPWSYSLRLSVQTMVLEEQAAPRLHVHIGMRRWTRFSAFDPRRAIGVHLLSPSPWATRPRRSAWRR